MINDIIKSIDKDSLRIRVSAAVFGELRRELGQSANKLKGVDFVLDDSLVNQEYYIDC